MTTNLEKQFFDTFGIEPIGCNDNKNCTGTLDCITQCPNAKYPEITDRILLELICILSESPISISFDVLMLGASDVEKLKGYILLACIGFAKDIKHQVQSLFKEER